MFAGANPAVAMTSIPIISNKNTPTNMAISIGGKPVLPKNDISSAPVAKPAPITVLIINKTSAANVNLYSAHKHFNQAQIAIRFLRILKIVVKKSHDNRR